MQWLLLGALTLLSACTPTRDAHTPGFTRKPYEPITRHAIVAIALREWRLFGSQRFDEAPGAPRTGAAAGDERGEGLWQRVGEYWWLGLNADETESDWTGKHDEQGELFPAARDGDYAWSAAFVSYVMRIAGAGKFFPYAASHWIYIDAARRGTNGLYAAKRPELTAPKSGDLICTGRDQDAKLRYDDLPAGPFQGHCDIVVGTAPGEIRVVGGNVDDGVKLKRVPVTPDGHLASADGKVLDSRYPWMVVLTLRD